MSGEYPIMTLWMALIVAGAPFTCLYRLAMRAYGENGVPGGCLALVGIPLLAAPFIGFWFYHTFAVVAR